MADGRIPPRTPSLSRWQRWVHAAAWVLLVVSGVAMVAVAAWHFRQQRSAELEARNKARTRAIESAQALESALQRVPPVAFELARDLSAGQLDPRTLPARLVSDLAKHPGLFEIGVAYLPFMRDPRVRLYAPHAARTTGAIESFQLEGRDDYTTHDWYKAGQRAPTWGDPYVVGATRTLVVGYSVPFFKPGVAPLQVVGLVRVNLTLDDMRTLISGLRLGQTGYGFLVSRKGTYLEHPDEDYVRAQRSALDDARELNDDVRLEALQRALRGEPTEHESRTTVSGQSIWVFNEPVKSTGWVLSTAAFADQVAFGATDTRRALVQVLVCLMMFLFAASLVVWRAHVGGRKDFR